MPKLVLTAHGHSLDRSVEWEITIPQFTLTSTQKRKRTILILFHVRNNSKNRLTVRILINSLSEVLWFYNAFSKMYGKDRIRRESTTLTSVKTQNLPSNQAGDFKFSAVYSPHLIHYPLSYLGFEYIVSAFNEEGKTVTHSDPFQILIPLTKRE
jgi:hypothetical protein